MSEYPLPPKTILASLKSGIVIPAHPLALTKQRKLDPVRQQALTRYYLAAGAKGLAIGVHTTQFEIHASPAEFYKPVLKLGVETIEECERQLGYPITKIAGICGLTDQAIKEANFAAELGFHAGLLSLSALKEAAHEDLLRHCKKIARIIPIFGFYLQPAVGGQLLPISFWQRFVEIENVIAIKIAPFNRYYTLDVVRAVAESDRYDEIALYTGNDDNIVQDLLTPFTFQINGEPRTLRIVGGLLGQWAVWTKRAVDLLAEIHQITQSDEDIPQTLLQRGVEITDANSVIFDVPHTFAGCIPGIHEILRMQGLLEGIWTLNPQEMLSPGQREEINRIHQAYPMLNDDKFVATHLNAWLEGRLF